MVRATHLRLVTETEHQTESLRIAFASEDMRHVDQHFGATAGFAVYEVSRGMYARIAVCRFENVERDGDHGKLVERIKAISECDAVYANAIGASAIRQLIAMGVQPLRIESGVSIQALIRSLQQQLRGDPPAWMRKGMTSARPESRFDVMESEGWQE